MSVDLTYKYELYINGRFAARHLTAGGAVKEGEKRFPTAKLEVFKVIPTVQIERIFCKEATNGK